MVLVRDGDAYYDAIYDKWFAEGERGWVNYGGAMYKQMWDVAGVVSFDSYTTTDLLDSRSLTDSKSATYTKLDDGGP
jgi:hypothetical protein